jgi:hypothetical protein
MKLDLETLKQVKLTFDIHSDHSTMCNGYRSLCRMIEEAEKEVNENFVQPVVIGSVCDCEPHAFYEWEKDENKCSQCGKPIYEQTDL